MRKWQHSLRTAMRDGVFGHDIDALSFIIGMYDFSLFLVKGFSWYLFPFACCMLHVVACPLSLTIGRFPLALFSVCHGSNTCCGYGPAARYFCVSRALQVTFTPDSRASKVKGGKWKVESHP